MRLIDADNLIPMIRYATIDSEVGIFPILIGFDAIKKVVDEAPTIEAEPVRHGHWIKGEKIYPDMLNDTTYGYWCSECHHIDVHGDNVEVLYCWHCGAKMDLKEVEE